MNLKTKIIKKYDSFCLAEGNDKEKLRAEIKALIETCPEKDSDCYHILGLIDYESDDWQEHINTSIDHFKKALERDSSYFLAQLYLAHCYHDLNELEIALENYLKVDRVKLKEFQIWRYVKLIEQIGYCNYKLGYKEIAEQHFEEVLGWYKKLPDSELAVPSELMSCLDSNHPIVTELKKIGTYLD